MRRDHHDALVTEVAGVVDNQNYGLQEVPHDFVTLLLKLCMQ